MNLGILSCRGKFLDFQFFFNSLYFDRVRYFLKIIRDLRNESPPQTTFQTSFLKISCHMDSIQTKEVWGWEKKYVFFKADWHSLNMSKTQTKFRLDCILSAEPYMFKCLRSYKFFLWCVLEWFKLATGEKFVNSTACQVLTDAHSSFGWFSNSPRGVNGFVVQTL